MGNLYRQSYFFWVISKVVLTILLLMSTLSILAAGRLSFDEPVVNLLILLEAILLGITVFQDFSNKPNNLKIITGTILILFGTGLFIFLLTVSEGSQSSIYILGYPLSIWMALIGIFEVLKIKKAVDGDI